MAQMHIGMSGEARTAQYASPQTSPCPALLLHATSDTPTSLFFLYKFNNFPLQGLSTCNPLCLTTFLPHILLAHSSTLFWFQLK